jgi:hypothetical protein
MVVLHSLVSLPDCTFISINHMIMGYDYSIVDLPTKDGGFPYQTVSLPEGSEYGYRYPPES